MIKIEISVVILDRVSRNTNYSVDTILEWYKGFIEDCPDGKLTPDSFMKIYGTSFVTGNAREFCQHVFRTFDKDRNGYIDFKEVGDTTFDTPDNTISVVCGSSWWRYTSPPAGLQMTNLTGHLGRSTSFYISVQQASAGSYGSNCCF